MGAVNEKKTEGRKTEDKKAGRQEDRKIGRKL